MNEENQTLSAADIEHLGELKKMRELITQTRLFLANSLVHLLGNGDLGEVLSELPSITASAKNLALAHGEVIKNERLINQLPTDRSEVSGEFTWKDILFRAAEIKNEQDESA